MSQHALRIELQPCLMTPRHHLVTGIFSSTCSSLCQLILCQCILSTPAHVIVVVKMSTSPNFPLAASSSMPTLATWGEENTTLATLS